LAFWRQTDKQTNKQMDSTDALSRSRCRERLLNNCEIFILSIFVDLRAVCGRASLGVAYDASLCPLLP